MRRAWSLAVESPPSSARAHTRDVGQDTGGAVNEGVRAGGGSLLAVAPSTTSEGTPPVGALM